VELNSHLSDSAVAFVKQLLPSVVVEPDTKPEPGIDGPSYHIHLPPAAGAEYRFTLWSGCGEKQISARLLTGDETAPFWYMPFERAAFRSAEQLNEALLDALKLIMRHNTRIEQKHGFLFEQFKCEYESASGWKRLDGVSYLRLIPALKTLGRKHVYQSPPLVPDVAPHG
jgi:hypothetical protein